jgi:hypothetical protein
MVTATDDSDFTDDFCNFLQRCVVNVDSAELVLALAGPDAPARTAQELTATLARTANVTETDVQRLVDRLVACGVLERLAEQRFGFRSQSPDRHHVATLGRLYLERPVTLFRVIYALRDSKIKTFSDAFDLWR